MKADDKNKNSISNDFAFGKNNYVIFLAGLGVLALGYILMIGGGSEDPYGYSEEVFNPRRITLAPIVIMLGFAIILFSILKKPND